MIIIRGGVIVSERAETKGDLAIAGGQIERIAATIEPSRGDEVVDASGCHVLPGLVDPHLHIRLDTGIYKTPDDWEKGSRSAALGGITTVIDFATQFPTMTYAEALSARRAEIDGYSVVDYALHMMVTDRNKAGSMKQLGDGGVGSIKVYTTYRPNYHQDDDSLLAIMREAAEHDLIVLVHAENDALVAGAGARLAAEGKTGLRYHGAARPEVAEVEAAHRVLFLAREAGCRLYIVHNSSHRTVDEIVTARRNGLRAWSETCPQYLTLDERCYESKDAWRFILQPPLRSAPTRELLWKRVVDGSVDSIGTDHCDYSAEQKLEHDDFRKTPGGLPGLATSFALMHQFGVIERGMPLPALVRLMSANPARIFGLSRKGALEPGRDADVVIFDSNHEWTIRGAEMPGTARYSPWEGVKIRGRVRDVYSRGEAIVRDGEVMGSSGRGLFVRPDRQIRR